MNYNQFIELAQMVSPLVTKQDTSMEKINILERKTCFNVMVFSRMGELSIIGIPILYQSEGNFVYCFRSLPSNIQITGEQISQISNQPRRFDGN